MRKILTVGGKKQGNEVLVFVISHVGWLAGLAVDGCACSELPNRRQFVKTTNKKNHKFATNSFPGSRLKYMRLILLRIGIELTLDSTKKKYLNVYETP